MDDWMLRLKRGYDAGYYRTEAAPDEQSSFPWQNKRCGDCPFWMNDLCRVNLQPCSSADIPCGYYDPPNFSAAEREIDERLQLSWEKVWRWQTT